MLVYCNHLLDIVFNKVGFSFTKKKEVARCPLILFSLKNVGVNEDQPVTLPFLHQEPCLCSGGTFFCLLLRI